jgi:hypothetical protein
MIEGDLMRFAPPRRVAGTGIWPGAIARLRLVLVAITTVLSLSAVNASAAQEVRAEGLTPFDIVFQRVQVCANAVLWRDAARIEGLSPEVLSEPSGDAPLGDGLDAAFYRAFVAERADGTSDYTLWLRAVEPTDGGETTVSCEVYLWPLSDDESLQMVQQVIDVLRGPFVVLSDWEQVNPASRSPGLRATGRMTVCSGRDRPLRLFVTFGETGYPARVRFGDEPLLQREGTCAT